MPRGGAPHNYVHHAEREVPATREYDFDEVTATLTLDDIMSAQVHQLSLDAHTLLTRPLPSDLESKNPDGVNLLKSNSTLYEDEVEDSFDADTKLREIYLLAVSHERAELIRTRRTILGYLALTAAKKTETNDTQGAA